MRRFGSGTPTTTTAPSPPPPTWLSSPLGHGGESRTTRLRPVTCARAVEPRHARRRLSIESWVSDDGFGVPDDPASRAAQRELVRRGYDAVSHTYRTDLGESSVEGSETTTNTPAGSTNWCLDSTPAPRARHRLRRRGPADRLLVEGGMDVTGIDISPVQIERARDSCRKATFVGCDIVDLASSRRAGTRSSASTH